MSARQQAKAAGRRHYMPSRPCQRGHLVERFTSTGNCTACLSMTDRARYDRETVVARVREQRQANPQLRRIQKLRRYGLTLDSFAAMVEAQGGGCKVCRTPLLGGQQTHVDHCHTTGVVRGILCSRCNTAIGLLDDSPERAEELAAYLRRAL